MVTSRSAASRLALAAALGPPAPPPTTTNLLAMNASSSHGRRGCCTCRRARPQLSPLRSRHARAHDQTTVGIFLSYTTRSSPSIGVNLGIAHEAYLLTKARSSLWPRWRTHLSEPLQTNPPFSCPLYEQGPLATCASRVEACSCSNQVNARATGALLFRSNLSQGISRALPGGRARWKSPPRGLSRGLERNDRRPESG